ncbi:DNA topoisomerase (ATP-hydrolyzing) [Methanothermus fervidus DSM 2088]|uniref:Type 2 DNA topoisomerase 6 subunit A n=1 Tax=Methanothermus fervidus (strain ATCC 43054 / DSM 2088 / JCM 10308 / V24 S) TaxID=523846 RepID=E3GXR2_METFV|nr:DNA topoisomerase IV subunit A [Methanothermus fervidus]ADP77094.1 DNA topoisomerase (ATP-hydrolyzing) [Methanothermus fervidus DSM 2088]
MKNRKVKTLKKLKNLGKRIITDIQNKKIPKIKVPSRSTSNIIYDDNKRHYVLGDKYGVRSLGNVKQLRKIGQMLYVANFCKELIKKGKTATLREMYYVSEGWDVDFNDQQESNNISEDLEIVLGVTREDLGLLPEEDGASVYGKLTVREGDIEIDAMKAGKSGYTIPPTVDEIEFVDHDVERVIAVETMGMYHRLVQEKAHKKFDCLIVGLKGQAARATRRFLKRLNEELKLPVYICNDGDPWGFHIAMVIISGSAKLAHVNHELATPNAKFLGVTATDIINYDLPTDPLEEVDIIRLKELLRDPRYKDEFWRREIKKMLKIKKKAEQQSFSKYGLEYVVDTYLPEKLEELEG